jgi:ectoine hydroxylase-related dioxygenase (phytanoyl-CoA dioxygenase family)
MGWISSCYYVGLPAVVADENAQQGWIKFGEPNFKSGLAIRRAIQPQAGRLVLFPSYMWHGTIPFRSSEKRTTIAFDVVPTI